MVSSSLSSLLVHDMPSMCDFPLVLWLYHLLLWLSYGFALGSEFCVAYNRQTALNYGSVGSGIPVFFSYLFPFLFFFCLILLYVHVPFHTILYQRERENERLLYNDQCQMYLACILILGDMGMNDDGL